MAKKRRILVVDDESAMREVLQIILEGAGYETVAAKSTEEAVQLLEKQSPDLVLTDLHMNKDREAGLRLLSWLQEHQPFTPAIMISAFGTVEIAVAAMRLGALDFLQKPFHSNGEVVVRVERALDQNALRRENQALRQEQARKARLQEMVGISAAFEAVMDIVRRVAALPSTVAIYGESGVGKELVAHALHRLSPRGERPFVAINCGGIPENLLESELFGYKKGAFTGAIQDKEGLFVVADGGTIFLDEIGEMPPMLQVKLLRVLDNGTVTPVGGLTSTTVDVRVITATNRNLAAMEEDGSFRRDLYYRINVIPIHLPPLRERREDIPLLARHLLAKHANTMKCAPKELSREAESAIMRHGWPGNIRELSNVLERAMGLSRGERIELSDLPTDIQQVPRDMVGTLPSSVGNGIDLEAVVAEFESRCIKQALELGKHSQQRAAKLLGLSPRSLRYRLDKYNLHSD